MVRDVWCFCVTQNVGKKFFLSAGLGHPTFWRCSSSIWGQRVPWVDKDVGASEITMWPAFDFEIMSLVLIIINLSTCPHVLPNKETTNISSLMRCTPNRKDSVFLCAASSMTVCYWLKRMYRRIAAHSLYSRELQLRALLLFCKAIDSDSTRFITSAEFSAAMTKFEFTKPSKQQLGYDGLIKASKQKLFWRKKLDLQMFSDGLGEGKVRNGGWEGDNFCRLMNQGSSAILTRMVMARSSLGAKLEIEVTTWGVGSLWFEGQVKAAIRCQQINRNRSHQLICTWKLPRRARYQSFYLELSHFNAQVIEDVLFLENWNPLPFLVVPPNYKAGPLLIINIQKDQDEKEKANFVALARIPIA